MAEERDGPLLAWPAVVVLAVAAAGLLVVAVTGRFRPGTLVLAAAVVLAGWLRALLPHQRVGVLAVRGRGLDVAAYLLVGGALVVLALVVPLR